MADEQEEPQKKKKDNKISYFMAALQPKDEYFPKWSDDLKKTLADPEAFGHALVDLCNSHGYAVADFKLIVHDKDTRKHWDMGKNAFVEEPEALHYQLCGRFESKASCKPTMRQLSSALGIPANFIERPKRGMTYENNALAYEIHAKDEDKYQYDPHEVIDICGRPYMDYYYEYLYSWEQGKVIKTQQRNGKIDGPFVVKAALNGEITEKQCLSDPALYRVYGDPNWTDRIEKAFDTAAKKKISEEADALRDGKFSRLIAFIYGKPGTGKSILAEGLVDATRYAGMRVCRVAPEHAVDSYSGEEVVLMDDVSGSACKMSEWKRLTDPHADNPATARYHNKPGVPARMLLIATNENNPETFFLSTRGATAQGGRAQNASAMLRRINMAVEVRDPNVYGTEHNVVIYKPCAVKGKDHKGVMYRERIIPYIRAGETVEDEKGIHYRLYEDGTNKIVDRYKTYVPGMTYEMKEVCEVSLTRAADMIFGALIALSPDYDSLQSLSAELCQSLAGLAVENRMEPAVVAGNMPPLEQPSLPQAQDEITDDKETDHVES